MKRYKNSNQSGFSILEIILVLAIIALAFVTLAPALQRIHEEVIIERTARSLEKCIIGLHFVEHTTEPPIAATNVTYSMIMQAFQNEKLAHRFTPPNFPREVDYGSFTPMTNGNVTVDVLLKSGSRTVTTNDITSLR